MPLIMITFIPSTKLLYDCFAITRKSIKVSTLTSQSYLTSDKPNLYLIKSMFGLSNKKISFILSTLMIYKSINSFVLFPYTKFLFLSVIVKTTRCSDLFETK